MEELRLCKHCNVEKPILQFGICIKGQPYRRHKCDKCRAEGVKLYADIPKNKETKADVGRRVRKENKEKLREYFGGEFKCVECSFTHTSFAPFDLHHIDPSNKSNGIGKMMQLSWVRIKAEAEKCILLCSNCHRLLHYYDKDKEGLNEKSS